MIRAVADAFPPRSLDTASLVETLGRHGEERRDLGFGVSLVKCGQAGGYMRVSIRIADWNGQAAIIRADFIGRQAHPALRETWPHGLEPVTPDILRYQVCDEALSEAITGAIAQYLGRGPHLSPGPDYAEAYASLMDSLAEHHYGRFCYIGGTPPEARQAIEALIAGQQYPLARDILRSPNPEARVYAVEALRRWEKAGTPVQPEDKRAIDFLALQTLPIYVCDGCLVFSTPQNELLAK